MARFSINLNEVDFDEIISIYDLRYPMYSSARHQAKLVDIDIRLDGRILPAKFYNFKLGEKGIERVNFYCNEKTSDGLFKTVMTKPYTHGRRSSFVVNGELLVDMLGHIIKVSILPCDVARCRRICINRLT